MYNRTVRCSSCYRQGHNRTGCPDLKSAWEKDPESWEGKQWARILETKAKPRHCGYCSTEGHTRAQCDIKKTHMTIYQKDLNLWRKALVKIVNDLGLGKGALVRCNNSSYNAGERWKYPNDDDYVAPVAMAMEHCFDHLTHFHGVMNSNRWLESATLANVQRIDAPSDAMPHQRHVSISLPCIQGLVPRFGKAYWQGEDLDRNTRLNNNEWEVVSRAVVPFDTTSLWFRGLTNSFPRGII